MTHLKIAVNKYLHTVSSGWIFINIELSNIIWFNSKLQNVYFANGRYVDCLSLAHATNKSKRSKLQYRY
jgi:hypothetical protein